MVLSCWAIALVNIKVWLRPWPSDKHNLITANVTSLIFSLFDVASARDVPFGIPQCAHCILHGLTSTLLCVPFIFADIKMCRFGGCMCNGNRLYFSLGYLDYRGALGLDPYV